MTASVSQRARALTSSNDDICIGVDLGGTNMQAVVISGDGAHITARSHRRTNAQRGADAVVADMIACVRDAVADTGLPIESVAAVGVAAPGAMDMQRGIVLDAPNLGWRNMPLRDCLHGALGIPVHVDNDVNAAAWGEFRAGAGREHASLFAVWVGTGVGGGLVINKNLYYGPLGCAGEFGQSVLIPDGRHGSRVLEDHCGRVGIIRLLDEWSAQYADSPLTAVLQQSGHAKAMSILSVAFDEHDRLAVRIVEHIGRMLGIGIANAVTLLALDAVVVGGGVVEQLEHRLLDRVRDAFKAAVFPPDSAARCALLQTELRGDAGTLGAALLARSRVAAELGQA